MEKVNFKLSSELKEKSEKLFEDQKEKIIEQLPYAEIEHIGGTAIPNLYTKGDLDINIRVEDKSEFQKAIDLLKSKYEINQPDNWNQAFASFKDDSNFELPLGIQLTIKGTLEDHFIRQRDKLLAEPELVEKYNTLRLQYHEGNMKDYRTAKDSFLRENALL